MKLLLDTCTFLWAIEGGGELSEAARDALTDPDNDVVLSAVSAWEIAVKHAPGRLPLPGPPDRYVPAQRSARGIAALPLDEDAASIWLGSLRCIAIPSTGCWSARRSRAP